MSASENDCRKAFEEWMESCSISIERDKDAWGRPKYRHSHVGAMWEGFDKGRRYQLAAQSALLEKAKEALEQSLERMNSSIEWHKEFGRLPAMDGAIAFVESTLKAIREAGV